MLAADRVCANCQAHPLHIEKIRSAALFEGVLRQAIHRFKYERLSSLAEPFGDMLADYWRAEQLAADWLIPVPCILRANVIEAIIKVNCLRASWRAGERAPQRHRPAAHAGHGGADDVECCSTPGKRGRRFECVEPRVRGARVMIVDDVARPARHWMLVLRLC